MLECLILGDSIAVGMSQFKPECRLIAKGGINTWQFNRQYKVDLSSEIAIISLGSNDHSGINTRKELEDLRSRIVKTTLVYWILPAIKPHIQLTVKNIAQEHGDIVISIPRLQKDGIHPSWAGYKEMASMINSTRK